MERILKPKGLYAYSEWKWTNENLLAGCMSISNLAYQATNFISQMDYFLSRCFWNCRNHFMNVSRRFYFLVSRHKCFAQDSLHYAIYFDCLASGRSLFLSLWFLSPQIFETYSTICKPLKKEHPGSTQQISEELCSGEKGSKGPVSWPSREHCYEAVGEKTWSNVLDSDPAYATINHMQKRELLCNSTLKPKEKSCGPLLGPERALTCENFYESIEDVKQGTNTTNTTTIFTFNDGMEMYITGL